MLTEVPRAIRGKAAIDPDLDLALSLGRSEILLQRVTLHPIDRLTLWRAGRDAFVTYDMRQAEAAHVAGLNVRSPGA